MNLDNLLLVCLNKEVIYLNNDTNVELTTSEISSLWGTYMSDNMATCVIEFFLNNVKDDDARQSLQTAYDTSYNHVNKISAIFNQEGLPVPQGFNRDDFNTKAPRLYTDPYYMFFIYNMSVIGMTSYTLALTHAARSDVRQFYADCLQESISLYNNLADIMLNKGIYIRAPIVAVSKETSFIENPSFLQGLFKDEPRSLLSIEISNIFINMLRNVIGMPLLMGFAQVAQSEQVQRYMLRGREIASKHIQVFRSILEKEDVPVPSTSHSLVADSTEFTFSDKLMMFVATFLTSSSLTTYSTGMATSLRHDLNTVYLRLSAEIAKYASDGVNIMIENRWMEQPPQAIRHESLLKV
jgi:spore coat protein CotF